MANILTPDNTSILNGVKVNEYLLTKHNPNKISMPTTSMSPIGVTIHNTGWINVASGTTPAEQYTRATVNGNMNDVRVHYYVDDTYAWKNLPINRSGWHATDGNGNGNSKTIAIECIMANSTDAKSLQSEDNCAKLTAYLLHQYGWTVEKNLFTHTYWLHIRDGYTGTIDQLNVRNHSYKNCPQYIIPHWDSFKAKIEKYLNELNGSSSQPSTTEKDYLYKVKVLDNALNIRDSASINAKINGVIKDNGTYRIVEECYNSNDGVTWGKLYSGAGWISTNPKYVQKV